MLGARTPRWVAFGLWLSFLGVVIYWANTGTMPRLFKWIGHTPGGDKLAHFLLVGMLAFLLNWALRGRLVSLGRWRIQLGGLLVACFMTVEECTQLGSKERAFELADLVANYAGVLMAGCLYRSWNRVQERTASQARRKSTERGIPSESLG